MHRIFWTTALLAALALVLPTRAWALRCGTRIVEQGDLAAQVREECGAPFYKDYYVGHPGVGVNLPVEPGAVVAIEAWYYNFGPQRLMVQLVFSGGVLVREKTLGYGFVGQGGPCDFNNITQGMSVAELIAHCGYPSTRSRNPLAIAAYQGAQAPAWGETWFYPADGARIARVVHLQRGKVVDVEIVH
ncbi:MAG TPA: DUF2845 domain-containing protein [Rhodanobacteraceae bacterium]